MDSPADFADQFFARTMRNSDVDLVVQNEMAAFEHPWTKRIFIDCLQAGYQCWVLANRQKIVSHGVMSVAIGECHLLTLCVHPDHQRQGYGRRLFMLLLAQAFQQNAKECFLEVRASNSVAIALYNSLGFSQIGLRKNYYPSNRDKGNAGGSSGREDALIMSRSLPIP
ncbi:MAG: ribosomal protein S18-alanine N-acetyltransferase [Gammaproteobacteria bacterium]|nr:ribosomal protein S18-alanine N-acetyltransferase [Gammaproteobacteria bacterium]MCY4356640.1 ribosomal protein S18-alanine N-acetyltransferase [Gammaproteobacteria bacterium]